MDFQPARVLPRGTAPEYVSLAELKTRSDEAFDLGLHYKPYSGKMKPAYEAGRTYAWLGADFRGTVNTQVMKDSLSQALEDGFLDGGERGLPTPRTDYKAVLTDPEMKAHQGLMDKLPEMYVLGFDLGNAMYKAAGVPAGAGAGSSSGSGMSTDSGWGAWLVTTLALSAVAVATAVIVRHVKQGS